MAEEIPLVGRVLQDVCRENRELQERVATLEAALREVQENLCRYVPDGYSQSCVDEDAEECDAIIEKALKGETADGEN